ncbi:MAG: hypothetical protein JWP89_2903 [Schlesneria sp.]|nr:hypothetical protein [Schlesneria sp.]
MGCRRRCDERNLPQHLDALNKKPGPLDGSGARIGLLTVALEVTNRLAVGHRAQIAPCVDINVLADKAHRAIAH